MTALPFQVRALRKSRGWTQEEFAKRAGMAQSRIPDLERPVGKFANLETLCRVAAAFDVALEVRFVPFSELTNRAESFVPDQFNVPGFAEELDMFEKIAKTGYVGIRYAQVLHQAISSCSYAQRQKEQLPQFAFMHTRNAVRVRSDPPMKTGDVPKSRTPLPEMPWGDIDPAMLLAKMGDGSAMTRS